jgi:hypothetical protein
MAEYTNIACQNKQSANALLVYLDAELKQDEEPPDIAGVVSGSTLHLTHNYDNPNVRREWDVAMIGFRDGWETAKNSETDTKIGGSS